MNESMRGSRKRQYVFSAIIESLNEGGQKMTSKELAGVVSKKIGKPVSSRRIGMHMKSLYEGGHVSRDLLSNKIFTYSVT
jgi:repressor of nif and glnA expression